MKCAFRAEAQAEAGHSTGLAGRQGGESGEMISRFTGCELLVNNFLNCRHFEAHRLHTQVVCATIHLMLLKLVMRLK